MTEFSYLLPEHVLAEHGLPEHSLPKHSWLIYPRLVER